MDTRQEPSHIRVFDVTDEGRLTGGAIHATCDAGPLLPESVANLTFGGFKRNHLYITAGTSLYSLRVTVNGAEYPR